MMSQPPVRHAREKLAIQNSLQPVVELWHQLVKGVHQLWGIYGVLGSAPLHGNIASRMAEAAHSRPAKSLSRCRVLALGRDEVIRLKRTVRFGTPAAFHPRRDDDQSMAQVSHSQQRVC